MIIPEAKFMLNPLLARRTFLHQSALVLGLITLTASLSTKYKRR